MAMRIRRPTALTPIFGTLGLKPQNIRVVFNTIGEKQYFTPEVEGAVKNLRTNMHEPLEFTFVDCDNFLTKGPFGGDFVSSKRTVI